MAKVKVAFERGTDNVFAELGLSDADVLPAKARLSAALGEIADKEKLGQTENSRLRQRYARMSLTTFP